jgi:hypothetical protein
MMLDRSAFPPLPVYAGNWAPLYLEPMMGSGERLTVAVAALGYDGAVRVIQAIAPELLDCMYGTRAAQVQGLITLTMHSLSRHLGAQLSFEQWQAPLSHIYLGKPSEARADTLSGLLRQGLALTASLADLQTAEDDATEEELMQVERLSHLASRASQ